MKKNNHFITLLFFIISSLLLMSCNNKSLDSHFEKSSLETKRESLRDYELGMHSSSTPENNTKKDKEELKKKGETLDNEGKILENKKQTNLKKLKDVTLEQKEMVQNLKYINHQNEINQSNDGMSLSDRIKYIILTIQGGFIAEAIYGYYKYGPDHFLKIVEDTALKENLHVPFGNSENDVKMFYDADNNSVLSDSESISFLCDQDNLVLSYGSHEKESIFLLRFHKGLKKFMASNYLNSSPFFSKETNPHLNKYISRKNIFLLILTSDILFYAIIPHSYEYVIKPILYFLKDLVIATIYTAKGIVYDMPRCLFRFFR